MQVATASSGGHPGRANEDFVGATIGGVVLLDGAGIPGTEGICRHGTAWYATTLGSALLARLAGDPGPDLRGILAVAIEEVADRHRGTCDIADISSPQATVLMLRLGEHHAEYLALGDSTLIAGTGHGPPRVVTDDREVTLRRALDPLLEGRTPGTPEHDEAILTYVDELRARRNQPGGYWLAKDDPVAADEAVLGRFRVSGDITVALLSNGVTRLVHDYRLLGWGALLDLCRVGGPTEVLRTLRRHEARIDPDRTDTDDATVAVLLPHRGPARPRSAWPPRRSTDPPLGRWLWPDDRRPDPAPRPGRPKGHHGDATALCPPEDRRVRRRDHDRLLAAR